MAIIDAGTGMAINNNKAAATARRLSPLSISRTQYLANLIFSYLFRNIAKNPPC
jgi:hypothetical protein